MTLPMPVLKSQIRDRLHDNDPVHLQVTYVSVGATSHFKNKYQLHKVRRLRHSAAKWMISATEHGKTHVIVLGYL